MIVVDLDQRVIGKYLRMSSSTPKFPPPAIKEAPFVACNPHQQWTHGMWKRMTKIVQKIIDYDSRQQLKYIDANKHALHTYHDSFLFGELPLCVQIRAALRHGSIGLMWSSVHTLQVPYMKNKV